MNSLFTIGADPELFVKNKKTFASIVGLLGGTKQQPLPIGEGCAVQEDNVTAEFCIPPCNTKEEFVKTIQYSINEIKTRVSFKNLSLAPNVASAIFPEKELKTPQAQEFGCTPDFNIYTGVENPFPVIENKRLRSAGGHIHIGTKVDIKELVPVLDLYLGVPSVILDKDTQRRQLYGKAGCIRIKPYGVEYRTLSNFWIWETKLIEWVYHQVEQACKKSSTVIKTLLKEGEFPNIINCINDNNTKLAIELINKYNITL